jgi:hypothetical protein
MPVWLPIDHWTGPLGVPAPVTIDAAPLHSCTSFDQLFRTLGKIILKTIEKHQTFLRLLVARCRDAQNILFQYTLIPVLYISFIQYCAFAVPSPRYSSSFVLNLFNNRSRGQRLGSEWHGAITRASWRAWVPLVPICHECIRQCPVPSRALAYPGRTFH